MKLIPLNGGAKNAHQDFVVDIGNHEVTFRLDYCGYVDIPFWNLSMWERNEPIVEGLTLQTDADLLAPYQLGMGKLIMTGDTPTLDNLGVDNCLVWVAEDEKV